jgi:uncharacterized membrane protein YfcA
MTWSDWPILASAAFLVGLSKTSISNLGTICVAMFAVVLPARESTAAILLLLVVGDIVAVSLYRRSADWSQLKRLLPAVLPGIVLGWWFLQLVSDKVLLISIGTLIVLALAIQVALRVRTRTPSADDDAASAEPREDAASAAPKNANMIPAIAAGVAAGFTTMVANAAGPVMSLYLLAIRADKARFVATSAWFFMLVNICKVPFSASLGLYHADTLRLLAVLIPVVLIGCWFGRRWLKSLDQSRFEILTTLASLLAGVILLSKGTMA